MREPTLDPVRRPRLPRGRTLVRAGLIAAFLLTAVAALYARDPAARDPAACAPPPTAAASAPSVDASGRLAVPPGAVGVPVRLAEPAVLALVHPGDRVDLLAASGASPTPRPAREPAIHARDALVLGVVGADGAVLLALSPERARAIVALPDGTRFGVIVRPK